MSSQRSVSHSTGPGRTAYPEDDLTSLPAASSSFTESSRSRSLSSEDGWHDVGGDDDIGPSDSVSRPPTASSTEAHSRRRQNRHQNSRPASIRRKSSVRVPTIPEESHRSHGSYSERRDHYPEEETSHHIRPREHRVRVPSSGSTTSSVESNEYHHMGGGAHYAHPYQQYPPYPHAPQPPQSTYPPTVISSHHGYDAAHGHGRTMPPYDAMIPMPPRQDAMSPYGYSPSGNPFVTSPSSSNPFSPMPSNVSAADDYFNPYSRSSSHGGPHHPHAIGRPPPPSRPLSYAGGPYAVDALAHYHQPQYPYPTDPRIIAQLYELNMNRANKSHSASPDPPRSAKPKSPAPAAAPPPPVEPVKEAPKEDQAEILMKLLAKHEADKLAAAEEKAKQEADAAAAEKAKKDAENTESAKIAAMLQKWEEERQKREADEKAALIAAQKAAEEKAAREAEIAALVLAAKEAANADAAAKAKVAEEEAAAKTKAIEEESAKAVAAAKAAAEEAEKARKDLEEAAAKAQPSGEDEKACIHFHDAMGRRYDLPWKFAKTFKGMEGLIKQAHSHIAVVRKNIDAGRYDLIGPDDNIILHQVWEMFVQPGWEVRIEIWPDPPEEPVKEGVVPVPPPVEQQKKPIKPKKPSKRTVVSDDDPIVEIIDNSVPKIVDNNAPKHKIKKKQQSAFSAWMLGTRPAPRKPAGKDSEKPEMGVVHYVSNGSGNAHAHAHAQAHVRARSSSNHRNSEDYYMVGRGIKSTALPSVSQGKAAHVDERTVEVPCSVM